MSLDLLKQGWQSLGESKVVDDAALARILQRKSKRPIAKIKRNLFWELMAVLVLYVSFTAYYFLSDDGLYWTVSILLFALGAIFGFYYYKKSKLLHKMECVACEVKSNLENQVKLLEQYVRLYFILGNVLTPVAYISAGLIAFYKTPNHEAHTSEVYPILFGSAVLLTIGVYFLNKWYVRKLYGQHVDALKTLLKEME